MSTGTMPIGADEAYLRRLIHDETEAKHAAQDVMNAALSEGRDMTPDERAKVEELHSTWVKARDAVARAQADLKIRNMFEEPGKTQDVLGTTFGDGRLPAPAALQGKTLGEMFVSSGVWKGMKQAKGDDRLPKDFSSAVVAIPMAGLDVIWRGFKAASSPLLESNYGTGFGDATHIGPITTLLPGVERPGLVQLPPTISDLLRVIPISQGNSVTYRIQKSRTMPGYPASQPVAENAVKPTYATEFDVVQVAMKKLAAITKISEEWLEDDEATVAFLNTELPLQLRQVEESWLAALLYTGTADATPLGYGTVSFDNIAAAISTIQTAGFNPNGMVIRPADWWNLSVSKFGTGAGDKEYIGGGPFGSTGNPWGLRVVFSPYATAGHPLIGDFTQGGYIARRGGLRMDSTNSDGTDFDNNIVTLRVEMREAFAKVYPEAFKTAAI